MDQGKQKLKISQTQSHSSVSFFEMHVPVRVWENGTYKDLRIHLTKQNQEFVLPVNKADRIEFDPNKWLCARGDIITSALPDIQNGQIVIRSDNRKVHVMLPESNKNASLEIIDLSGKLLLENLLNEPETSTDVSELVSGVYLVIVKTRDQQKTEKIFIQ